MKLILLHILFILLAEANACMATSILFPAFNAPLITDNEIIAHHTYGKEIICLDKTSCIVRWKIYAKDPIQSIFRVDSNMIAVIHAETASIIDVSQGTTLKEMEIPGSMFGKSKDNHILSITIDDLLTCSDLNTGKLIWKRPCRVDKSNLMPLIVDDLIFLSYSPSTITTHSDSNGERVSIEGTNLIACHSAKDGTAFWREPVLLSNMGFAMLPQAVYSSQWILCTAGNTLRLIDRVSGGVLFQKHFEDDVDGADFWMTDRIAVCFGGIGANTRTIRVLNANNFDIVFEFSVDAMEVANVDVVGHILILNSLYRNIGVDLRSQKIVWEKGQRHYTVQDGLLYFGESANNQRILGICNPTTGTDRVIYSEPVEDALGPAN